MKSWGVFHNTGGMFGRLVLCTSVLVVYEWVGFQRECIGGEFHTHTGILTV